MNKTQIIQGRGSYAGWTFQFKVRDRWLVTRRTCDEAGLDFREDFDFDCFPAAARNFYMDDTLRKCGFPANARKAAIKILP